MSEFFHLKTQDPVAGGGRRLVFAHPRDPSLIIKVYRPQFLAREWGNPSWRQKRRRYRHLFPLFQEVREHIAICAAEGRPPKHMQNLVGFAETDHGLGLIYDAVRDGSGNFAPTLGALVRTGRFTPELADAFSKFQHWLVDAPIVVLDLRPDNFVCAQDETGKPHFVLIDGVGEKTVIPIKGFVPWLNRRSKIRQLRKLDRELKRLGGAS